MLWASTIKALVQLTCEFLTHCLANGVIFNESKFQFCKRTVEFMGFLVSDTGLRPTGEMLRTLAEFPRPADLTGVLSFFGLVEQVSWAFTKTDAMAPFTQLLKTKEAFMWTQELQTAFEVARDNIVQQVRDGVTNFVVGRRTAMCMDWSKVGISVAILQQHCGCKSEATVRCCESGWKLCFAGSRFCSEAESRYSPVEGEALAVAWGLRKARFSWKGAET